MRNQLTFFCGFGNAGQISDVGTQQDTTLKCVRVPCDAGHLAGHLATMNYIMHYKCIDRIDFQSDRF